MNKNLIYRIIGAVAAALIIVGVFVPFVNVLGFTENLWKAYQTIDTAYLSIMVIGFAVIAIVVFAINYKTELAYLTTGGIIFFIVIRTMDAISQSSFSTLSIGYYFMIVGAIVTGIIAFLTSNNKETLEVEKEAPKSEESINIQPLNNDANVEPLPVINNEIELQSTEIFNKVPEPINVEPLNNDVNVEPLPVINNEIEPQSTEIFNKVPESINVIDNNINDNKEEVIESSINIDLESNIDKTMEPIPDIEPVLPHVHEIPDVEPAITPTVNDESVKPKVNPVVQEFLQPSNQSSTFNNENSNLNNNLGNSNFNDMFGDSIKK